MDRTLTCFVAMVAKPQPGLTYGFVAYHGDVEAAAFSIASAPPYDFADVSNASTNHVCVTATGPVSIP